MERAVSLNAAHDLEGKPLLAPHRPKKRPILLIIGAIVAAILILGGLVTGAYFLFFTFPCFSYGPQEPQIFSLVTAICDNTSSICRTTNGSTTAYAVYWSGQFLSYQRCSARFGSSYYLRNVQFKGKLLMSTIIDGVLSNNTVTLIPETNGVALVQKSLSWPRTNVFANSYAVVRNNKLYFVLHNCTQSKKGADQCEMESNAFYQVDLANQNNLTQVLVAAGSYAQLLNFDGDNEVYFAFTYIAKNTPWLNIHNSSGGLMWSVANVEDRADSFSYGVDLSDLPSPSKYVMTSTEVSRLSGSGAVVSGSVSWSASSGTIGYKLPSGETILSITTATSSRGAPQYGCSGSLGDWDLPLCQNRTDLLLSFVTINGSHVATNSWTVVDVYHHQQLSFSTPFFNSSAVITPLFGEWNPTVGSYMHMLVSQHWNSNQLLNSTGPTMLQWDNEAPIFLAA